MWPGYAGNRFLSDPEFLGLGGDLTALVGRDNKVLDGLGMVAMLQCTVNLILRAPDLTGQRMQTHVPAIPGLPGLVIKHITAHRRNGTNTCCSWVARMFGCADATLREVAGDLRKSVVVPEVRSRASPRLHRGVSVRRSVT